MRLQPVLAGVFVALILGGSSAAQTTADERPRLLTIPSASDLNDHFPPVARAGGLSGDVSLNCVVHLDGRGDCIVLSETPRGVGFGDAAVRMTANWRFAPATSGGQPVPDASRVFRIRFANEETQRIPLSAGFVVTSQRETPANVRVDAEQNQIVVTGIRMAMPPRGRPRAIEVRDEPASAPLLSDDRFYPEAARREGVAGVAIVACAVRSDRRPACGYEREFPEGFGFGDVAVVVATQAFQSSSPNQTQPASILRRFPVEFKFADPLVGAEAPAPSTDRRAPEAPPRSSFARQFPPRALERGMYGTVTLIGTIRADRHVECSVVEETPTGWGFAAAALVICRDFLVSEESITSQRSLVGDRIFMPVTFRVFR